MIILKQGWLLATLSGVLAALSYPGFELDFLAWFVLVPLFFALELKKTLRRFFTSFLGGVAFFGVLLYWILALEEWVGMLIVPGYFLLIGYLGLYWGAFGVLYPFFKGLKAVLLIPTLWVVLEFIRSSGKFGLHWGSIGYSLYEKTFFIQLASITGVWGVSFAIVLVNYLLFLFLKKRSFLLGVAAVAVVGLLFGLGNIMLHEAEGEKIKIAIVQPNNPQRLNPDPQYLKQIQEKYKRMLQEIEGKVNLDLVILPESTLPGYVLHQEEFLQTLKDFVKRNNTYLLFGTGDYRKGKFYNTAVLLSPKGEIIDKYDKVQLVPFGEFIPFKDFWEKIGLAGILEVFPTNLTPGLEYKPMDFKRERIGTPICFESAFPSISRKLTQEGASLLITITNDAWFKRSLALPQHFAKGVFRAVENRRFFIQAANTGISGIISPQGEVITRSGIEEEKILYGIVQLKDEMTFYIKYGDWFVYLAIIYLGIYLVVMPLALRNKARGLH
jgi:apolipoprotein N-acyltransferase